ncbi:ML domain-containing protein [Choanephora cucurbitarum]|nr:ML domain-containing protein [Choanephora cucurbitarum]
MKSILFCLIFFLLNTVSAIDWVIPSLASNVRVNVCSEPHYALKIKSIQISPNLVQPGGEVVIRASGTVHEPITPGSEADVKVKMGVVQLLHKRFDICNELEKNKEDVEIQCDIQKGDLTVTQKVTLPKEIPKRKFVVIVHATTASGHPLACLQIIVDFSRRRPFLYQY